MRIDNYNTDFDKYLIYNALPAGFIRIYEKEIRKWLSAKTEDEILETSVNFHRILVLNYLSGKYSEGKLKNKHLLMAEFEKFIRLVKVDIGNKFYRDHIAHVIRVSLLMIYLGKNYFRLSSKVINKLAIAGLFHDLAYPVQEIDLINNLSSQKLGEAFDSFKNNVFASEINNENNISEFLSLIYSHLLKIRISSKIQDKRIIIKSLVYGLLKKNHGILSAFELWQIFLPRYRANQGLLEVLLSISMHDMDICFDRPKFPIHISYNPVLFMLILCDELQEWNRWVRSENKGISTVVMKELRINTAPSLTIRGTYNIDKKTGFIPFLQATAKSGSLDRIRSRKPINIDYYGERFCLLASTHLNMDIEYKRNNTVNNIKYNISSICLYKEKEILFQYEIKTHSTSVILNCIKRKRKIRQNTIKFISPIENAEILEAEVNFVEYYLSDNGKSILCILSKNKIKTPRILRQYNLIIDNAGSRISIEKINISASYSIMRRKGITNIEKSTIRERGPVIFENRMVISKVNPYYNILLALNKD